MNEVQVLFLVLAALYLLQCIGWTAGASEVLRLDWRYRARVVRHSTQRRFGRNRFYFLNPLSPLGSASVFEPFPSVRSIKDKLPEDFNPSKDEEAFGRATIWLSEQEEQPIQNEGKTVVGASERLLIVTQSNAFAAFLAAMLERVRKKPVQERDRALEREFEKMFDSKKVSARLEEYQKRAEFLQAGCVLLFVFLFLLAPALIRLRGLERIWPFLLAYLLFALGWIGWSFLRAHRALYPEQKEGRWEQVIVLVLSPFSAIRANDILMRDLFCAFHPVAVGQVLLAKPESRAQAERILRQSIFRVDQDAHSSDAAMRRVLESFVAKNGMPPEELLQAPQRESKNSEAYCPLCLAQFTRAEGDCPDCGDIPLKKF